MESQKKLTSKLEELLENTSKTEMLDIIVELDQEASREILSQTKALPRQERISALQKSFDQNSKSIETAITKAGGEVMGKAWINQTLKARVPVESVKEISEHEEVAAVDIPQQIEADY
jgi:hypothetical protein